MQNLCCDCVKFMYNVASLKDNKTKQNNGSSSISLWVNCLDGIKLSTKFSAIAYHRQKDC